MNDRVVLVTGGAGYIGSHVSKALACANYLPVVYDNLINGHEWAVKWGPLERGDILDRARLDEVFIRHRPVAVLHFAAFAYVGESVAHPDRYYWNNVVGSLTLIEAARDHGCKLIVFSSTCATYGIPNQCPITEDTPQRPINPYGRSKLMVERILRDFNIAYGMESICLRYFNAAGADPDGEIGEAHNPETHLIPLIFDVATGRRPHLTIFGTDYDTVDGTCVRDYIHVADLARAHCLALDALKGGAASSVYNLGNGQGFSVKQIIDAVRAVTGCDISTISGPRRAGDPATLVSDASRAGRELGWQSRFTDLDQILSTAWAWYRS